MLSPGSRLLYCGLPVSATVSLSMWHRLIMLQLQPSFRPQSSRLLCTLSQATVAPLRLPTAVSPSPATMELPYHRTTNLQAIPSPVCLRLPVTGRSTNLSQARGLAAASVPDASSQHAMFCDNISDADWSEVEARLGEMAASKNRPSLYGGLRRNEFELMPIFMQRAGLSLERLAHLKFIHVAGTKGKGSTCAMVESILRSCGYRTALYTSPHLVDVRERIRVDGQMLPRAEFAAAFRRVYGALRAAADRDDEEQRRQQPSASPRPGPSPGMPSFFYFVTILAMDALLARPPYLRPQVVVLEVGIGGRLDATNAVVTRGSLAAAAITPLGFDHMEMLGNTLPEIAREKAGIMKPGRPVLAAPQEPVALEALQEVAAQVGAQLRQPPPLERYRLAGRVPSLPAAATIADTPPPPPPPSRPAAQATVVPHTGQDPAAPQQQQLQLQQEAQLQGGPVGGMMTYGSDPATSGHEGVLLGIGGKHMRLNAALAVALAAEWEVQYSTAVAVEAAPGSTSAVRSVGLSPGCPSPAVAAARAAAVQSLVLPPEYAAGLRNVRWPGRSQVVNDDVAASRGGRLTWYLDGAHTPESMAVCATWFAGELAEAEAEATTAAGKTGACQEVRATTTPIPTSLNNSSWTRHAAVLLFNCMRERDPAVLLPALATALAGADTTAGTVMATMTEPMWNGGHSGGDHLPPPAEPAAVAAAAVRLDAAIFTPMLSGGGLLLPAPSHPGPTQPPPQQQQQGKATAAAGIAATASRDLTWQIRMRNVWESTTATSVRPSAGAAAAEAETTSSSAEISPVFGRVSMAAPGLCSSGSSNSGGGDGSEGSAYMLHGLPVASVVESLPVALEAVRAAAVADPRVHVHVLVTGSLYLVGDVLRLLNKSPS